MKVDKVVNNNIVSSFDENDQEVVVMGRGLGFKLKPGQDIDEKLVEKIFRMDTPSEANKLKTLFAEMPLEHIQVSNEIIHYAKSVIGNETNKNIYLTLTDHISFAIERYGKGLNFKNALLWEIKKFYRVEFAIGQKALEIIEERLGVILPEDEAGSIAMHFVNAQLNSKMNDTIEITKIIQTSLNIVKYHFNTNLDEETLHYDRFISHLNFFAQRVVTKKGLGSDNDSFNGMIREQYIREYKCAEKIKVYIEKEYHQTIGEEEMTYLTVHIKRVTTKGES